MEPAASKIAEPHTASRSLSAFPELVEYTVPEVKKHHCFKLVLHILYLFIPKYTLFSECFKKSQNFIRNCTLFTLLKHYHFFQNWFSFSTIPSVMIPCMCNCQTTKAAICKTQKLFYIMHKCLQKN
jgi:hypothetical protein